MDNKNQNVQHNANSKEDAAKMHKKIKETWSGLSDSDINLYDGKREEFFTKLKEKANISKDDAQKKLQQIEKDCGCSSTTKAA